MCEELDQQLQEAKQRFEEHKDNAEYYRECTEIFNSKGFNWQFPTLP